MTKQSRKNKLIMLILALAMSVLALATSLFDIYKFNLAGNYADFINDLKTVQSSLDVLEEGWREDDDEAIKGYVDGYYNDMVDVMDTYAITTTATLNTYTDKKLSDMIYDVCDYDFGAKEARAMRNIYTAKTVYAGGLEAEAGAKPWDEMMSSLNAIIKEVGDESKMAVSYTVNTERLRSFLSAYKTTGIDVLTKGEYFDKVNVGAFDMVIKVCVIVLLFVTGVLNLAAQLVLYFRGKDENTDMQFIKYGGIANMVVFGGEFLYFVLANIVVTELKKVPNTVLLFSIDSFLVLFGACVVSFAMLMVARNFGKNFRKDIERGRY